MNERTMQFPEETERPALRDLWLKCFPDDADGYCDFFLDRWFRPERCLVLREGDQLQTMAHLFSAEWIQYGVPRGRFLYLYAIGTEPDCRGRGNLGRILRSCLELADRGGFSGILLTAAEGLETLYAHYGMEPCALRYETIMKASGAEPLPWTRCSYERYAPMRRAYLSSLPSAFCWEADSDRFFYEVQQDSGAVMQWQEDDKTFYAVTGYEEGMPTLLETDHPVDMQLLSRIAASMGAASLKVCSPMPVDGSSKAVCFGQWLLCGSRQEQENAYLNLIAD